MHISLDFALIGLNLLALAYSYGRFSEKISSLERSLVELSKQLTMLQSSFYASKDGIKLEAQLDAIWNRLDNCPCKVYVPKKEE